MINRIKKYIGNMVGFGIIIGILFGIVYIISMVGGSIMKLFGFSYQSVGCIVRYFILIAIIGFPLEVFAEAFPKALKSLGKMNNRRAKVLTVIIDMILTSIVMSVVDYYMKSVSASEVSILIVSFIMAVIALWGYED